MESEFYVCSRRTIMDGEVVTLAPRFFQDDSIPGFRACGPFEISASREAVMVHYARFVSVRELEQFEDALRHARDIFVVLSGLPAGSASAYPAVPKRIGGQAADGREEVGLGK